MPSEFYIGLREQEKEVIPLELLCFEEENQLHIGTSFGNTDREAHLNKLMDGFYGEENENVKVDDLFYSDRRYFSKWGEGPLEFFDKPRRFTWHIPKELCSKDDELYVEGNLGNKMFNFWDNILDDNTPIEHCSPVHEDIYTWKDLKNSLTGPDREMDISQFIYGTFARLI